MLRALLMSEWLIIFILTLATGLAMVVGAFFAALEHLSSRWLESELRHTVIALGGGILLSAVALVLVNEGMLHLTPVWILICFGSGGLAFMLIDLWMRRKKENASQFAAMLLDFIPEVTALGSLYLLDKRYAVLLAFMIILQNIPEGFNAYLELRLDNRHKGIKIIGVFFILAFLGPLFGLLSYFFLSEHPEIIAGVMMFAAGGILYLIFQDIAPMAKIKNHRAPALGAVAGFLIGILGKMLIVSPR